MRYLLFTDTISFTRIEFKNILIKFKKTWKIFKKNIDTWKLFMYHKDRKEEPRFGRNEI